MIIDKLRNLMLEDENEDDDYLSVCEIYDDDDENEEDEWDDETHSKNEAIQKIMVIRNGKPTRIARSTKPGYKIINGEEIKMSLAEIRAREKASKKTAAKTTQDKIDIIKAKQKESMDKRQQLKLNKPSEDENVQED